MGQLTEYLLNILLIQISVVVFISPFYLTYRLKSRSEKPLRLSLNRHIEYFFSSQSANYLVFFWALGEAIVWFIIPEFLLLLLVFMRIKKRRQMLIYDIYGTLVGIILAVSLNLSDASVLALPYVQENMIGQVRTWYESAGILGLIYQPFSGVPFKVFNHLAPQFDFNLALYTMLALIVRVGRYAIFYLLFNGLYSTLHKIVYKNFTYLFIAATVIFSILLYKVYLHFGPSYVINPGF